MIATFCMNPCFDRTVTVDCLTVGGTNRVRSVRMDVGGKGVNVARVLSRLGMDALCLGTAGRENAASFLHLLEREQVRHCFMEVAGSVRTNTKVVSLSEEKVTEINEPGPVMTPQEQEAFVHLALPAAQEATWCVLTGSLPGGCNAALYSEWVRRLGGQRCILDAAGDALLLALPEHPFLVKPNRDELCQTLGRALTSRDALAEGARELVSRGARHVLVSLGGDGALLVDERRVLFAPPLPVRACSTVGAGDAMVAGLLYGLQKYGRLEAALCCGTAAGAASVMTEGTQLVRPEDFEALRPQAVVQEV